ncbi:MAG: FmdB family transcriptional regulator [Microbacteriaceae bacterium]|nr:FmdB family transcriptional regulator [Microbacteriaceae bacterium]
MPTYAYRCADCDHAFDIYQQFSDDALTECPECSGTLRKVFGSIGVTFNGSGFYRTDSRAESKTASSGKPADSGSSSSTASTSSTGSASSTSSAPTTSAD